MSTPDQKRRRRGQPDNQGTPFVLAPLTPGITHPDTQQFTIVRTLYGKNVSAYGGKPTWESSDPTKATIDANGLATSVAAGPTTITVSYPGVTPATTVLTVS